jgi:hypothetical protein
MIVRVGLPDQVPTGGQDQSMSVAPGRDNALAVLPHLQPTSMLGYREVD